MQTHGKFNDIWLVFALCQGRLDRKIKLQRGQELSMQSGQGRQGAWPQLRKQIRFGLMETRKEYFSN